MSRSISQRTKETRQNQAIDRHKHLLLRTLYYTLTEFSFGSQAVQMYGKLYLLS